ncbi:S8 family serine peptidase [Peribacillus butanolivorans]|uniref:S8 family serine peptidase n=1 Tax=Peribacillus butanolivorans TaxID=421767 RepID=UPI00366ECA92
MQKKRRTKWLALIFAIMLIGSLVIPTNSIAATSNKIHTSAKDELTGKNQKKVASKVLTQFKKNDQVTFLVKFKEQVDTKDVSSKAAKTAKSQKLSANNSKLLKRSSVVSELRATALQTQANIKNYLDKQEKAGKAKDFQSFYIVNAIAVTATKDVMEQIAAFPEVEKIMPNETRQLIQPASKTAAAKTLKGSEASKTKADTSSIEWNIEKIGAPAVWNMGIDGAGTVIASIDTGVQWNHPALKTKYRGYNPANPDVPNNEYNWFDAVSGQASPYDDLDHGTHTIGTMVGSEPNGANQIGVAPGATFISVKAFSNDGGSDIDLLEAGEWVIAPKDAAGNPHPEKAPDVVNNSWGGGAGLDEWYRPMVQAWKAAEIFPEFSAGNTTLSNPGGAGSVANPANYPEAFATGATDLNNQVGSFSLRGPSPYGEIKPDISAPGVNIRSAVPGGAYEGGWNGTSMAGPHISAVAALLRQANASLTVDQLEEILLTTATPLTDNNYPTSPNHAYGYGLVNAFDAVSSVVSGLGKIEGKVTKAGDDSEAAVISHKAPKNSYKKMDITLQAEVSDNVSVTTVKLSYQKADGTWVEVKAERTSGDYKSGTYEATIPGSEMTEDSVTYKWTATDFGGSVTATDSYTVELLPGISVGYTEDFEQDPIGWTSSGTNNNWEWGIPTSGPGSAASGQKVYATNLAGNYANSANMSLSMPPVDVPEGTSYLQFKHWFELEKNYDFGHVFISTNGTNWVQAARFNDKSNSWIDGEVNLSQYAGERIYIAFNVTSDGSVQKPGWYIDDVKLADTSLQPAAKAKTGLGVIKSDSSVSAKPKVDPDKIKPIADKVKKAPEKDQPAPVLLPLQAQVSVLETGRSVYTNPQDGSYQLTHASGSYTLQAETYGYRSQTETVNVEQDATSTANFTLQEIPKGTINGTITNKITGEPVSGATVYFLEDAAIQPVTTNSDGEYTLSAYEGKYTLKVMAPSYYGSEASVTISDGNSSRKDIELKPFIGYPDEIKYDDGTAENARAFNTAGNSWAVKMSLASGNKTANVTGALLRFWDTTWPAPGGTEFQVSVYDASGTDGSPGKKIAGPFNETALRDGQWTHVDLSEHGIMVEGDFFIVYTQTKANPNAPGLATDEDGPNAGRSWQGVSDSWSQSPTEEGNYMIRATVDYEVKEPVITSPKDGAYSNQKEVTVEGTSAPTTKVDIFNKGEKVASTDSTDKGTFAVPVTLSNGDNTLTAKARTSQGSTEASLPVKVILDSANPELAITSPTDGSKVNRETVTVKGTVSDDNLNSVKVNGQKADVKDNTFSYRLLLDKGINKIKVVAQDKAGNKITKSVSIDVKYTAPEISGLVPNEDKILKSGESVKIEFDSEPGLAANFSILMPLTNAGGIANATELPMKETSSGHYVGYYTATTNVKAPGAVLEVKAADSYGNITTQRAAGKLWINAKK